jgi:hypothetical protein
MEPNFDGDPQWQKPSCRDKIKNQSQHGFSIGVCPKSKVENWLHFKRCFSSSRDEFN